MAGIEREVLLASATGTASAPVAADNGTVIEDYVGDKMLVQAVSNNGATDTAFQLWGRLRPGEVWTKLTSSTVTGAAMVEVPACPEVLAQCTALGTSSTSAKCYVYQR